MTRLPGHRARRFYIERTGETGRLHFMDGTPTTIVLEIGRDESAVLHWIGLPQLDWNRVNGMIYTPTASVDVQFLSGGIFHYLDGLVFSVLYAAALFPLLRWRSTVVGNLLKGLLFGTVLATISCAFMTPRVYFPNQDVGFFSHNLGWQTILAVYLWHWVFGAHLGAIYNPEEERSSVTHHQTRLSSNGTGDVAVVSRSPARPAL